MVGKKRPEEALAVDVGVAPMGDMVAMIQDRIVGALVMIVSMIDVNQAINAKASLNYEAVHVIQAMMCFDVEFCKRRFGSSTQDSHRLASV